MVFSNSVFLFAFLPTVLLVYYGILRKNRKAQNIFLFIASLGFYAWGEPLFVLVMLASITANWVFGLMLERLNGKECAQKLTIITSLIFNLGILFAFKYLTFVLDNINLLIREPITVPVIGLPIGISFFTFQAISYVIDVSRGRGTVQRSLVNLGLYISFFPQLIAGPIVRYETVAEQIENRRETTSDFAYGVRRFVKGFGKKVLIANNVAIIADAAFSADPGELTFIVAWLGIISYTLQIFFDFSGYSDMAIGLGRMFGFHFEENFNYPYISKSISEFWRRWHISLGTWFRDYVYFPLGGSWVDSSFRLVFNLFVVWMLTGLWHGANWTFILWGFLYFVLISMEKLLRLEKKSSGLKILPHIYTMLFVMVGWVIFRAETVAQAVSYLRALFVPDGLLTSGIYLGVTAKEALCFILLGIVGSMPIVETLRGDETIPRWNWIPFVFYLFMFLLSMAYVVKGTYDPFIYFNF